MFNLKETFAKSFLFAGLFILLALSAAEINAAPNFDYDGKADFGVFRPSERMWYSHSTESALSSGFQWGLTSDVLTPGDYDGDGITDFTVWRPSEGVWYVNRSRDQKLFAVQWGTINAFSLGPISDVPVPGDYDGDGVDDFAVWRPTTGVWYVLQSSGGYNPAFALYFQSGQLADIPVPADYDGDGKTDFAVFRPTENRWYINRSSDNQLYAVDFGEAGEDLLVPSDYTGDGKADVAVYRKGNWLVRRSQDNQTEIQQFGLPTDRPVPGDYDGDGRTDLAVYRNGTWFILQSASNKFTVFYYGLAGDVPLAALDVKPSIVPIP